MSEDGPPQEQVAEGIAGPAAFVVVHLALLVYLRFWVRTDFIYFWPDSRFPDFLMRASFFREFLPLPAGIAAYAGAFGCQLFYFPWAGAAAVAAVSGIICVTSGLLIRRLTGRRPVVVHLLPAVLVAVCYGVYANALPIMLVVGAAGLFAAGYAWLPRSWTVLRALLALPASVALYYLLGGGYLVFAMLCMLFELRREAAAPLVIHALAAVIVPPAFGMGILHLDLAFSYEPLLVFRTAETSVASIGLAGLLAVLPLCLIAAAVARGFAAGMRGRRRLATAAVFCVLAACAVWLTGDPVRRTVREVEYACAHEQWLSCLEAAQRLPAEAYTQLLDMTVNFALYHTGTMGENLFLFPQQRFGIFRCPEEYWGAVQPEAKPPMAAEFMRGCEIFYELGRMNEAEHMAADALWDQGARPWLLEKRAMIRIVKGDFESARPFLRALENDLIGRGRARRMLDALDRNPDALVDSEMRRLRELMIREDTTGLPLPADILRESLAANGSNRMAFDYLMADHLLKGEDLLGMAAQMHRLDDVGYRKIPRLYEEALLVLLHEGSPLPDLGGYEISAESKVRFAEFLEVVGRNQGNQDAALQALDPLARFSFMAYYFLHLKERDEA